MERMLQNPKVGMRMSQMFSKRGGKATYLLGSGKKSQTMFDHYVDCNYGCPEDNPML